MKLTVVLLSAVLLGTAACGGSSSKGPMPGAPDSRAALDGFLNAVRAEDLQAMSNYWGNAEGPARDRFDRVELEKRELIMICHLAHDRVSVMDEQPREGGRRAYSVRLSYGNTAATTEVTTVRGPSDRWYVENARIDQTQSLCQARNARSSGPR